MEVTATQFDRLSLTPLSLVICGRLQVGGAHWATSVAVLQVVDNWSHAQTVVVDNWPHAQTVVVDYPPGVTNHMEVFSFHYIIYTFWISHQIRQRARTFYKFSKKSVTLTIWPITLYCGLTFILQYSLCYVYFIPIV